MQDSSTLYDRRRVLHLTGTAGALALAGCLGDDDHDPDDDDEPLPDDNDEPDPDDDDDPDEVQDLPSTDPSPEGTPLNEDDILALIETFDDNPFNDAQREIDGDLRAYTPEHVWKWVSDSTFIGLHFNDPNPEQATELLWSVVGTKGVFTEESQPEEAFTHFHQHTADAWEAGHGGDEGAEGYWLAHIAVQDFEAPAWTAETGVDYDFMPTPPADGSTGHDADWASPDGDEDDLDESGRDALIEVFDDQPFNEPQREADGHTPSHTWKWVTEDVFIALHWDEPVPTQADNLLYSVLGVRGQFHSDDQPDTDDFTHFHLHEADAWDAGHGGADPDQWGYWLVHFAVRDFEMPWGDVSIGVDRDFMPTDPPE